MSVQAGQHHVVTLGTAGGPRFWRDSDRAGIATAIVVDDGFYLVDCGHGVGRQIERAGLSMHDLKGVFITHLHSDHTIDLNTIGLFGLYEVGERSGAPIPIFGPGNRGVLPPTSPQATVEPQPIAPHDPTPGTRSMFRQLMEAHATDLNDRILDSLRPSPFVLFDAQDIQVPPALGFHANENPTPLMEPFKIFEDSQVTVTAILVEHPPIAPAFAFRFETAQGSIVISGDTTFTPNMITIAQGAGLVLHEAIDFDFIESLYADQDDEVSKASREHHYKSHTSVADAVTVAREAGAKRLALHHLVPGLTEANRWENFTPDFDGEFIVASDLQAIAID